MLERVIADLSAILAQGRKLLIGVPVHFDTLAANSMRLDYLKLAEAIPPPARRLVIFELVEIPSGVPQGRMREVVAVLKRNARAVIADVGLQAAEVAAFRDVGVLSIGGEVTSRTGPESTIIEQMQRFVVATEKANLSAFVHGLRSISLTSSAVAAGFRYIDGDMVRSVVDAPQEVIRYNPADLYRRLLQGRSA